MHTRPFTSADGRLYVICRNKPARRSLPEKVAAERDFYEFKVGKLESNFTTEEFLSSAESCVAPILKSFQDGVMPSELRTSEAVVWARYVGLLFLRSRKMRRQLTVPVATQTLTDYAEGDSYLRNIQYEIFKKGTLVGIEHLRSIARRTTSEALSQPAFLQQHLLDFSTDGFADKLLNKRWQLIRASASSDFVISDCPVLTAKIAGDLSADQCSLLPGFGIAQENTAVFVAVSPKIMFVAMPGSRGLPPEATRDNVALLNRFTIAYAETEVYSRAYTEALQAEVDSNIDSVKFGSNAYLSQS